MPRFVDTAHKMGFAQQRRGVTHFLQERREGRPGKGIGADANRPGSVDRWVLAG
jgi:hypothetical protein